MTLLVADVILFDLDGVLVDSSGCVAKAWFEWAARHGLDAERTFALGHGRTTADHLRAAAPDLATPEEAAAVDALEERYVTEVVAQPGAREATAELTRLGRRWGIVTSCDHPAATARLAVAGIPAPDVLVTAADVEQHKPAPDGYLLGCRRTGVEPAGALVFEDAPAGLAAARAAGIRAVALSTTHDPAELTGSDAIVPDLAHVRFGPRGEVALRTG
ncbi:HAD-IA family hydrolase [Actinosynnema sp. NPDC047251]|uniref:HAD-superfamily hydrolase n=1 Tax=Saccharothrix espanaensis (strain ATCC 51144 / DSM 44229 / JCM 9112 / NBRC 15066 / NRRL 15764) TaxID=1179773 RepID=K0K7D8_SACES|nr:HAD-IA family hydrolase [Saccharothrix espanaensis]CCH32523.1 HAD-superfamily hydrolase [Saccharothrix espanaensis DSM 44229]